MNYQSLIEISQGIELIANLNSPLKIAPVQTWPIAISRVLRAISDGPTNGQTGRQTDQRTDRQSGL